MPNIPQIVDAAKAKWSVAGTVKRRWFVFALGCVVGFALKVFVF